MMFRDTALLCICLMAAGHLSCTVTSPDEIAGGSSSTDNGKIVGVIHGENGKPAPNTQVSLRSSLFKPNQDTADPSIDTTDSDGRYEFDSLSEGMYTIEAVALESRSRTLIPAVMVDTSTTFATSAALAPPGALQVEVPNCTTESCYVYIPGTSLYGIVRNGIGFIDSVPAGVIPAVYYANMSDPEEIHTVKTGITIGTGITHIIRDFSAWVHTRRVYLNTTANGAAISEHVYEFPVLVRLSGENFDFSAAQTDGSDIRFRKTDDTPLPYEIERWDPVGEVAEVWVMVDTVYGNDSTHFFLMYWGNSAASSESNSGAVFDTANGYEGVWHLAGKGDAVAFDATVNHYDGTPYGMTEASEVAGAIGTSKAFNGSVSYLAMEGTSDSKLDFPQNGTYTISVWAYADTIDSLYRAIAGKGHEQYYMQFKGLGENRATWEFVEFQDGRGWEYTEDSVPPAPGARQWIHLVGVRDGRNQRLYINGELVVDTASLMEGKYNRVTTDNFLIGRYARSVTIPYRQGFSYFHGRIDEVRVKSRALTADRIRLNYMNQKADDALVSIRQ
ncbi:MAG: DUF2341 domain-containing protein [Chitinispirillaceae bacterium]|nr:DUF2341 domain-containing protein [Chitinispirillaceae bacterium]